MEFLHMLFKTFIFIKTVCNILEYIFKSIAMYSAAKVEEYDNPWIAFIPYANSWLTLKIGRKNSDLIFILVAATVVELSTAFLPIVVSIQAIILAMALYIAWFIVFKMITFIEISKRYEINVEWFVIGAFIVPISCIGYYKIYKKCKNVLNGSDELLYY
ncbi:hypothetical protein JCM1393_02610 [Clostridium carnis]